MQRTYAPWVKPAADTLAADRAEVITFARAAQPGFWGRGSVVESWQNRDILAHLAGGNDQLFQVILRAVIARQHLDGISLDPDTDAENAAGIEERRAWTIDALIAELERGGDEVFDLLAKLTDDDRERTVGRSPMTVGDFVRIVHHERHDLLHLQQLREGRRT